MDAAPSRRDFFRSVARYLTLAGLVSMAGFLWARQRSAGPEACINLEICHGCPAFEGCALPPALARKRSTEDDPHAG